jgi:hypothetical protein
MNIKKGEIWICKEPYCAAEIQVVRAANTTCHGNFTLRCCCGKDMVLKQQKEHRASTLAGAGAPVKH